MPWGDRGWCLLGLLRASLGTGELECKASPLPSNLLYLPSVQKAGCAAKTKDMSLHGCYRLLWDELFGFRQCPAACLLLAGHLLLQLQWHLLCSGWDVSEGKKNGLFYSFQPGEDTSRAPISFSPGSVASFPLTPLHIPATAEDMGFEVVLPTRSQSCSSLCSPLPLGTGTRDQGTFPTCCSPTRKQQRTEQNCTWQCRKEKEEGRLRKHPTPASPGLLRMPGAGRGCSQLHLAPRPALQRQDRLAVQPGPLGMPAWEEGSRAAGEAELSASEGSSEHRANHGSKTLSSRCWGTPATAGGWPDPSC